MSSQRLFTLRFMLSLTLLSMSACGAVEDSTYVGESIFEIQGTADLQTGASTPSSELRVGLLWMHDDADNDISMQESQLGAAFPASFTLSVSAYPAESSLVTYDDMLAQFSPAEKSVLDALWPAEMKIGFALIVIWEDTNGNGLFDNQLIVEATGNEFSGPDRIVGGAPDHVVVLMDGVLPPAAFYETILEGGIAEPISQLGYTLLTRTGEKACITVDGQQECGTNDELEAVSADATVPLLIAADPAALAKDPTALFPNVALR